MNRTRIVGKPVVGGQEECATCSLMFRVDRLESGATHSAVVAAGDPRSGCDGIPEDNPYHPSCWDYWSPNEETLWLEALDEAIAMVFLKQCMQLFRQQPEAFNARLGDAFDSIDRLRCGKQPRYDDWDAPLYVSWYQARQVHLVYAVLKEHPPPQSRGPLQIMDIGCGAWAVPIALAMLAVRGHRWLRDREVSIHGIDPSRPMTRIGKELWHEFVCATSARGLDTGFVEQISDHVSVFRSLGEYPYPPFHDASATSWLLSIHALYDKSARDIKSFLVKYRERYASHLRYELLTTDGEKKKKQYLKNLVSESSGTWIVPQLMWKGKLMATTGVRKGLRKLLEECRNPMTKRRYMNYLTNPVKWDPSRNPIRHDAVWVRSAVQ